MKEKKVSATLRLLAGAYLCYLSYGLLDNFHFKTMWNDKAVAAVGIFYLISGSILFVWGSYSYIKAYKKERQEQ